MKKLSLISVVLVGGLFFGCTPNKIESVQEISTTSLKKIKKLNPSNPIILLGDTQEHEDFGEPVQTGTNIVDTYITDVTRRTAQANLNAIEILKSILKQNKEKPIIHMGDFLDVSCHDEFTRAINVLSEHDKWIIMFGNHDGYYLGNFLQNDASKDWAKECDSGRFYKKLLTRSINKSSSFENTLDFEIEEYKNKTKIQHVRSYNKSTVIERYLSTLFRKNKEVNQTIHTQYNKIFDSNHRFLDTNKKTKTIKKMENLTYAFVTSKGGNKKERIVEYNNDNNVFIKKIYAYINQNKIKSDLSSGNPQKSFLLQKVSLKENEIELILLDTSVYEDPYSNRVMSAILNSNDLAGVKGGLISDKTSFFKINQLEQVKKWIEENDKKNITTIFAGHHPLGKVDELEEFFQNNLKGKKVFYISAHTHQGFWRKHENDNKNVTELNIGSLIDFPVHYRTLQVEKTEPSLLKVFSELKEVKLSKVKELTESSCKFEWLDYSSYPYADPSWQENENKRETNIWNSKHLKLLPYLSYYLKLLETDGLKEKLSVSFQLVRDKNNTKDKNIITRESLIAYLKNSIKNFKKKMNNQEESIDNHNSCMTYNSVDKSLSTRDCSNLLYRLKKDENKIFQNFNQDILSTYKVCTALNAIKVDAQTSKAKINYKKGDLNNKAYRECGTLYDCQLFELENRKIKEMLIE